MRPRRSPTRRRMKSPATVFTAARRLTLSRPLCMSGVCIEPDRSTASMMLRPATGRCTVSPTCCGLAAATTSSNQAGTAKARRARERRRPGPRSNVARMASKKGKRRDGIGVAGARGSHHHASSGSGNKTINQGHANTTFMPFSAIDGRPIRAPAPSSRRRPYRWAGRADTGRCRGLDPAPRRSAPGRRTRRESAARPVR